MPFSVLKRQTPVETVTAPENGGATPPQPHWYVARIRSNPQGRSELLLSRDGFEVWFPMQKHRTPKRETVLVPLFPGYLFIRFADDPDTRLHVLRTTGVISLLGSRRGPGLEPEPEPLPDRQIESLRLMVTLAPHGIEVHPTKETKAGTPVRVLAGPYRGIEGKFVSVRNRSTIVISMGVLGQDASVLIDPEDVETIQPARKAA